MRGCLLAHIPKHGLPSSRSPAIFEKSCGLDERYEQALVASILFVIEVADRVEGSYARNIRRQTLQSFVVAKLDPGFHSLLCGVANL